MIRSPLACMPSNLLRWDLLGSLSLLAVDLTCTPQSRPELAKAEVRHQVASACPQVLPILLSGCVEASNVPYQMMPLAEGVSALVSYQFNFRLPDVFEDSCRSASPRFGSAREHR